MSDEKATKAEDTKAEEPVKTKSVKAPKSVKTKTVKEPEAPLDDLQILNKRMSGES